MSTFILTFFQSKARKALNLSKDRAQDLSHFKQIKNRLNSGEDLSKEIPELNKLTNEKAQRLLDLLIKRCNTDLKIYWSLPKLAKLKLSVTHESFKGELIPRFRTSYSLKTKFGPITIEIITQGNYTFCSINTKAIPKDQVRQALLGLEKQLSLSGFSQ